MLRADTQSGLLHFGARQMPMVFGKGGAIAAADKREGDGASPIGTWHLRAALFRPNTDIRPQTGLPWRFIRPGDGWCDAVSDPHYNRPVWHPWRSSAEHLWRADRVYDVVIVLDHNLDPVRPGMGSAIFWHLTQPDRRPTEGCIAIERADMQAVLPDLRAGMAFEIC